MTTRRLPALLAVLGLALAGCGDDSDGDKAEKTSAKPSGAAPAANLGPRVRRAALVRLEIRRRAAARPPGTVRRRNRATEPSEELSAALSGFQSAAAGGTCEKLAPLRHTAERPAQATIGSPPSQQECTAFNEYPLPFLRDAVPVANERFGPSAVVDYTQNGKQATGLWLVEADGKWRYLADSYITHAVGSRPERSDAFDAGVNGFVAAAQKRDCPGMFRLLDASSPYVSGLTQQQWCEVVEPLFDRPNYFYSDALKDPGAKPRLLGKTRLNGIYEVQFGTQSWLLVGKVTPGNTPDADKQGHDPDGVQAVYSASYAPS